MNTQEIQEIPNPFNARKVLTKYEKQVFNFSVKQAVQESEPPITQSEALKKVSEQWSNEDYRKQRTIDFLSAKAEKMSVQLEQLDLCIDALKV